MRFAKIRLRLPENLKAAASRQAEAAGVSLNLFIATTLAARVGAQAESERYFAARGARTTPARARALLTPRFSRGTAQRRSNRAK